MKQRQSIHWFRLNLAFWVAIIPVVMVGFQNCAPKNFDVAPLDDGLNKGAGGEGCVGDDCSNPNPQPCVEGSPGCTGGGPAPVPNPENKFELIDQIVTSNNGLPVEFNAQFTGDRMSYQLSFTTGSILSVMTIPNVGKVEVLSQQDWKLRFTPLANFAGSQDIALHAIEGASKVVDSSRITLSAGVNTVIPIVQPALAVRGAACVMCHADVRSNIITDFGYGGDGMGRDYYFGKGLTDPSLKWNYGSIYGDHSAFNILGNWANLKLEAGKKVYVPKNAPVTGDASTKASGATTLKGYLEHRFANSPHASTRMGSVAEYTNVYIGAPSASRIRSAFGYSAGANTLGMSFIRAAGASAMSGIEFVDVNGVKGANAGPMTKAMNTGVVNCDGDLMVDGPLLLKNLRLNTKNGCRIYVTGSVFIYGPITYENLNTAGYEKANLQISSAKAIMMGLGELSSTPVVNGAGTACETQVEKPAGYTDEFFYLKYSAKSERDAYIQNYSPSAADLAHYDKQNWDSLYNRMTFWTNDSNFFRHDTRSGMAIGQCILDDYAKVGRQFDAACESNRRSVTYNRLLLNAPQVHSRYWGDFNGVIISEYVLPALGNFHFKYDPVFMGVGILPKLNATDYLKVD